MSSTLGTGGVDSDAGENNELPQDSIGPWAVPYMQQSSRMNCGYAALTMALTYFSQSDTVGTMLPKVEEELEMNSPEKYDDGGERAVTSIRLAIAAQEISNKHDATTGKPLVGSVIFYSTSLLLDETHVRDLPFYQQHADVANVDDSRKLLGQARESDIELHESRISMPQLLNYLKQGFILITLIDIAVVESILNGIAYSGFTGHFVVLVGYDANEQRVIIHDSDSAYPKAYNSIDIDVFEMARASKGTDVDTLILTR
eukprot:gb/GECG01011862.1/.p1 GENE.gb/GECG01011862.1/~~gb/GECG01011862.1/.p1  ORF type:complete len:258 (+),score=34.54 gb/GECG01011862.1/:1-774(+)